MGIIAAAIFSAFITLLGGAALMGGTPAADVGEAKSRHGAEVGIISSPSQLMSGPLA